MQKILFSTLLLLLGFNCIAQPQAQVAKAIREIHPVKDNLYRFQNNNHYSAFLVTDEGIILNDPISPDAAAWLNDEIQKRFNVAVRYVIYAHHRTDHSLGGEVFLDAHFIAQHKTMNHLEADTDNKMVPPDITFDTEMTIHLGDEEVNMIHLGPSIGDNLTLTYYSGHKALFIVDLLSVRSLPFMNLGNMNIDQAIDSLAKIEQMDIEIVIPGHGENIGTLEDVTALREYLTDLKTSVVNAIAAGETLKEAQDKILLEKYKDWDAYNLFRKPNIQGAWKQLVGK